jgi:hypothetical protein
MAARLEPVSEYSMHLCVGLMLANRIPCALSGCKSNDEKLLTGIHIPFALSASEVQKIVEVL